MDSELCERQGSSRFEHASLLKRMGSDLAVGERQNLLQPNQGSALIWQQRLWFSLFREQKSRSPKGGPKEEVIMLSWTITLLVIALIAALLGFTGIAGTAAGLAKILFAVFLVLFIVSLFFGRRSV
jgi:uncharacterized membrane protein YtjA (UPF0391 family)